MAMIGCCGCGCVKAIDVMKADLTWSTDPKVTVLSDPDNIFSLNYIPAGKSITFNVEIGCSNFCFDGRVAAPSQTEAEEHSVKVGTYLQYKHDIDYFVHPEAASGQVGTGSTVYAGYKTAHLFIGNNAPSRTEVRFRLSELDGQGSMFAMSGFKDSTYMSLTSQNQDDNYESADSGTVKKPWAWSDNCLAIPSVEAGSRFVPITFTAGPNSDFYVKRSIMYAGGRAAFRTSNTPDDEMCLVHDPPSSSDYARTVSSSATTTIYDSDPDTLDPVTIDLSLDIDDTQRAGGNWTLIYDRLAPFRTGQLTNKQTWPRLFNEDNNVNWNLIVKEADDGVLDATGAQQTALDNMKTLCADLRTWDHSTQCPDPSPYWYKEPTYTSTWTIAYANAGGTGIVEEYGDAELSQTGTFTVYERPFHRGAYDVYVPSLIPCRYIDNGTDKVWSLDVSYFKNWSMNGTAKYDSSLNANKDYTTFVQTINNFVRVRDDHLVTQNSLYCPVFSYPHVTDNTDASPCIYDMYRDRQYIAKNTTTNVTKELYGCDVTLSFKRLESYNDLGVADENVTTTTGGFDSTNVQGIRADGVIHWPWYDVSLNTPMTRPWADYYYDTTGPLFWNQAVIKDGTFEVVRARINGTVYEDYDICEFFDGDVSDSRYDNFIAIFKQYFGTPPSGSNGWSHNNHYYSARNIVTMTKDGDSSGFKLGIGHDSNLDPTSAKFNKFLGAILSDGTIVRFSLTPYNDLRYYKYVKKYGSKTIEFPYIDGGDPDDYILAKVRH